MCYYSYHQVSETCLMVPKRDIYHRPISLLLHLQQNNEEMKFDFIRTYTERGIPCWDPATLARFKKPTESRRMLMLLLSPRIFSSENVCTVKSRGALKPWWNFSSCCGCQHVSHCICLRVTERGGRGWGSTALHPFLSTATPEHHMFGCRNQGTPPPPFFFFTKNIILEIAGLLPLILHNAQMCSQRMRLTFLPCCMIVNWHCLRFIMCYFRNNSNL